MVAPRNSNGTFKQGNPGNPSGAGNPYSVRALFFKMLFQDNTTTEEFLALRKAILDSALAGNMKAAQLFLETLKGKPEQAICDTTVNATEPTPEELDEVVRKWGYVKPGEPGPN